MHVPGRFLELGLTEYRDACAIQMDLHQARVEEAIGDTVILTEHLPVYTLGRTAREPHVGEGWRSGVINGIPVCVSDRGGSVTYHGPGQLVGYPIIQLRDYCQGPKAYMNRLEEVVIRALEAFGLVSGRRQGMPGVWIEDRKIAAMGVRISRGVTRHGFALNVANDLAPFAAIVPCGLPGLDVTSISRELGAPVGLDRTMKAVVEAVQDVFGFALLEAGV